MTGRSQSSYPQPSSCPSWIGTSSASATLAAPRGTGGQRLGGVVGAVPLSTLDGAEVVAAGRDNDGSLARLHLDTAACYLSGRRATTWTWSRR